MSTDLVAAQQLLQRLGRQAESRIAALEQDLRGLFEASRSSNADDEHDPEGATIAFERAQLIAVLDAARRHVADVRAALRRIDEGTYGLCQRCSRPIPDERVLRQISQRVLWLSAAIVDAANAGRPNDTGVKVGGHQASSASMIDIMVALWFAELTAQDRVSVKPHAAPVLHAINYLLGDLDESYLPTLRAKDGLQSYPSRLKDPDTVDFSTGSVGIGATAPIWAAMAHRYLRSQQADPAPAGRFISLLGDAELDEGAIWEAVADLGRSRSVTT